MRLVCPIERNHDVETEDDCAFCSMILALRNVAEFDGSVIEDPDLAVAVHEAKVALDECVEVEP